MMSIEVIGFSSLPLAQVGGAMMSAGQAAALESANSWNAIWKEAIRFDSLLYQPLLLLGRGVAIFFLLIFVTKWVKDLLNDEGFKPAPEMIWVVIVIVLLGGPGNFNVAGLSYGIRTLINGVDYKVNVQMDQSFQIYSKLAEMSAFPSLANQLNTLVRKCDAVTNSEEKVKCYEDMKVAAESTLNDFKSKNFGTTAFFDFIQGKAQSTLNTAWALATNPGEAVKGITLSVSKTLAAPWIPVLQGLMAICQVVFQHMIEMSLFITALLGPIAVGATLLPVGAKSIYLWLTGFTSLGLAKVCCSVLSGIAVHVMYGVVQDTTPVIVSVLMGVAAPVLALSMTAGGGMAVFNSLVQIGNAAINVAVKAVGI